MARRASERISVRSASAGISQAKTSRSRDGISGGAREAHEGQAFIRRRSVVLGAMVAAVQLAAVQRHLAAVGTTAMHNRADPAPCVHCTKPTCIRYFDGRVWRPTCFDCLPEKPQEEMAS